MISYLKKQTNKKLYMIMIMLNTFTSYIFHKLSSYKGAKKCQIRDATNIQRFVFYRYLYTSSTIFGHFHSWTCYSSQISFPVLAKWVSYILRTDTALRFWRKKLGECIQREITLRNQHSKTRFSFASICIFSFFFLIFFLFYSLFKYKTN